jgi:DNA-binding beta-propeller fold protein YncE
MQRPSNRDGLYTPGCYSVTAAILVAALSLPSPAHSQSDAGVATAPRLFFLDYSGQVLSAEPDGSDRRVLLDRLGGSPDGIAVDPSGRHIYWSNMGRPDEDDGSIMRADLDGGNVTTIVPRGGTFTAKQLVFDAAGRKLYWADREGMRIQRVNLDGTGLETLVEIASGATARENAANWAVGIAIDTDRQQIYWTQKGGDNGGVGSIRRAGIEIPARQTAANRTDIETLFDGLPEPIDLALDLTARQIYWTDRGDPPRGNTVNRAPMDPPSGVDPADRDDVAVLLRDLGEAIGIAIDLERDRMFVTELDGRLHSARLDGSDRQTLARGLGLLTGIAVVDLPVAAK